MTSKNRSNETDRTHTRGMSPRVAPPKPQGSNKPPGAALAADSTAQGEPTQDVVAEDS